MRAEKLRQSDFITTVTSSTCENRISSNHSREVTNLVRVRVLIDVASVRYDQTSTVQTAAGASAWFCPAQAGCGADVGHPLEEVGVV